MIVKQMSNRAKLVVSKSLSFFQLALFQTQAISSGFWLITRGKLHHVNSTIARTRQQFFDTFLRQTERLADILLSIAAVIGRWATRRRLDKGCPRSLWGITPLLTLPIKARCDRMLGFKSDSLVFTTYHVSSNFDINLSSATSYINRRVPHLIQAWCKLVLAWALLRYDVFHYFYDRGILIPNGPTEPDQKLMIGTNGQELELLEKADKRIYFYTYGSDVRARENTLVLGKYNCCMDCPEPGRYCICSAEGSRKNIDRIRPYARALLATTDNIIDVEGGRPFHYWALDLERIAYIGVTRKEGPLVIAHAPNHAVFKGSHFLEEAIAQLRAEGLDIELRMVSGVSNAEVLETFADADIIADQFISGGYGYTLLEGLACGKPVLCFLRNPEWIAAPDECPVIQTDPDRLVDTLRRFIEARHELPELGRQGRRYVERHYSIPAVAARLGELYLETGGFPKKTEDLLQRGIDNTRLNYASWLSKKNTKNKE